MGTEEVRLGGRKRLRNYDALEEKDSEGTNENLGKTVRIRLGSGNAGEITIERWEKPLRTQLKAGKGIEWTIEMENR